MFKVKSRFFFFFSVLLALINIFPPIYSLLLLLKTFQQVQGSLHAITCGKHSCSKAKLHTLLINPYLKLQLFLFCKILGSIFMAMFYITLFNASFFLLSRLFITARAGRSSRIGNVFESWKRKNGRKRNYLSQLD